MVGTALAILVVSALSASWLGFASVTAFSCSLGREPNPKENGIIRWVMPLNHRLRCQCTSIYPGGFNTYTPERGFDPFYTDCPLFTDLKTEIYNYFECEDCSLTCENGGTFKDDPCHCSCVQNWTGKTCTNIECSDPEPLGLEDGTIQDESISASTWDDRAAGEGRLDRGAWHPLLSDNSWFEVDLGEGTVVSGVTTQGYYPARVTEYKVKYKKVPSSDYDDVMDRNGAIQVFNGNIEEAATPVTNIFDQCIVANIVRIVPTKYKEYVALRLELLGCHIK